MASMSNGTERYASITHVIFDMDGLLLDTERHYTTANETVCRRHGREFTWEAKEKIMGRGPREASALLLEHLQIPMTVDEFIHESKEILHQLFPTAALMPGAERLVRHLHRHNVPIAIVTGSARTPFELKTSRHQSLFQLFNNRVVLTSEDPEVKRTKPAPDGFLVCAKRHFAGVGTERVLVFEDSPSGVIAAAAAGMPVVMVPDPRTSSEGRKLATLCLESLAEFRPELFGLPPYDDHDVRTAS